LEQDGSVSEIFVEVVDEWVNTEGVHPVTEGLFFTGFFDFDLEFNWLEGWPCVEEIGNEGQVELVVTLVDVLSSNELSAV